jgi:hypothetical protein
MCSSAPVVPTVSRHHRDGGAVGPPSGTLHDERGVSLSVAVRPHEHVAFRVDAKRGPQPLLWRRHPPRGIAARRVADPTLARLEPVLDGSSRTDVRRGRVLRRDGCLIDRRGLRWQFPDVRHTTEAARRRPSGLGRSETWRSWRHEVIHPGAAPDLRWLSTQAPRLGRGGAPDHSPGLDTGLDARGTGAFARDFCESTARRQDGFRFAIARTWPAPRAAGPLDRVSRSLGT